MSEAEIAATSFAALYDHLANSSTPTLYAGKHENVSEGTVAVLDNGVVVNPADTTRLEDVARSAGWDVQWEE